MNNIKLLLKGVIAVYITVFPYQRLFAQQKDSMRIINLSEVTISEKALKKAIPFAGSYSTFIHDFCFENDSTIIVLESKDFKQQLRFLHIGNSGITELCRHEFHLKPKVYELKKDCEGKIYLYDHWFSAYAYQIKHDSVLCFSDTLPYISFLDIERCVGKIGNYSYIEYANPSMYWLGYYEKFAQNPTKREIIWSISTENRRIKETEQNVVELEQRAIHHMGEGEIDPETGLFGVRSFWHAFNNRSFFEKVDNPGEQPSCTLLAISDSMRIFDHTSGHIWTYQPGDSSFSSVIPINYKLSKKQGYKVMSDEGGKRAFLLDGTRKAILNLWLINIISGQAEHAGKIENYTFPEKIKILGDKIFFIAGAQEDRRLYFTRFSSLK